MVEVAIAVGASVASAALSYVLTPKPKAQRQLDDLSVLKSEYGVAVPRVFGRQKVTGNVIWATDIEERREDTGGKGGGGGAEFRYYGTFAVLLAEGEIENIGRIWLNNKIVYIPETSDFATLQASNEFRDSYCAFYLGSNFQDPDPTIQAIEGVTNTPALRNYVYIVFRDLPLRDYGNIIPKVEVEIIQSGNPFLRDIIRDVCVIGSLTPDEIDISELGETRVPGAIFTQNSQTPRDFIEELQKTYHFIIRDTGRAIAFVPIERSSTFTVNSLQLDCREEGQAPGDLYREIREQTLDLPSQFQIEYPNVNNNYKRSIQTAFRASADHDNEINFRSSVVMDDSTALTAATQNLEYYWTQRVRYEGLRLPLDFLEVRPGDLLTLPIRNQQKTVQVQRVDRGANLILEMEAVSYDNGVNSLEVISPTVDNYNPPTTVFWAGEPTAIALDTALLRDSHQDFGIYTTVDHDPNGSGWNGGLLYSAPTGGNFEVSAALNGVAARGQLLDELPKTPTAIVDRYTKFRVQVTQQQLESVPDFDFYDLRQVAYINGELVAFQNANLVEPGIYEISNLIRGVRGTGTLVATHGVGSDFYLLSGRDSFENIEGTNPLQPGASYQLKAVPAGRAVTAVNATTNLTIQGNRLKPYAPCNPKLTLNSDSSLTIDWQRRSRRFGRWLPGSEFVPLEEKEERYELEILEGGNVFYSVTVNSPTYNYSATRQILDFGTLRSQLTIKVYQVSAFVGRGHPLEATLKVNQVNL